MSSGLIFVSVADMERAVARGIHSARNVDTVVGIPRSGMLPATMLATHMQVRLADLSMATRRMSARRSGRLCNEDLGRVLLVDDTANSGESMKQAVATLTSAGVSSHSITTCVVWSSPKTPAGLVDVCLGGELPGPRAFAWNLWKHKRLDNWAFDMDGVLTNEPPSMAKVSRESFDLWARELARPRWLPQRPIRAIITRRPEGCRAATEDWLHRHNVQCGLLLMAPGDTITEARQAVLNHGGTGAWKAGVLSAIGAEAYVESSGKISRAISALLPELPVWCTDEQRAYQPRSVDAC